MNQEIQIGDVLESVTSCSLAGKIRVIEVNNEFFVAEVLEGANTTDPLKVFRAGWPLYKKTTNQNN